MSLLNLVRQLTATTGTGTVTLGAAVSGFLTAAQAGGTDGMSVDYAIESNFVANVATQREVGTGVLGSTATTMTRVVTNSTNSNALLSLNGDAQVLITLKVPSGGASPSFNDVEDQQIAGGARVTAKSLTTGNVTIDPGDRPLQFITNGGAFTITAPANDGSCMLLVTNNASAGAITFSGFTVGPNTGDALTTTNTHKFTINIWRINGVSSYMIIAHQ
jgi:hypothetical protein